MHASSSPTRPWTSRVAAVSARQRRYELTPMIASGVAKAVATRTEFGEPAQDSAPDGLALSARSRLRISHAGTPARCGPKAACPQCTGTFRGLPRSAGFRTTPPPRGSLAAAVRAPPWAIRFPSSSTRLVAASTAASPGASAGSSSSTPRTGGRGSSDASICSPASSPSTASTWRSAPATRTTTTTTRSSSSANAHQRWSDAPSIVNGRSSPAPAGSCSQ